MRTVPRLIIVALLSLLLPLQGSLAYARSVSMAGKMMDAQPAAAQPVAHALAVSAADGHHAHHAHHGGHAGHGNNVTAAPAGHHQQAHSAAKAPAVQSHKHASNACDTCAKCCLAGAAAPPSVNLQSPDAAPMRIVFIRASASLSGFIPDGPERPPRHFLS